MLTQYEQQTAQLLQNPPAPTSLYPTASIDSWVNIARGQLAGESESIRVAGSLAISVTGGNVYPFSAINLPNATALGIEGVINVRQALYQVASGYGWLRPRAFEWFTLYHLNNPVPVAGYPKVWAQYGQGVNGTIYIDPAPDQDYTLWLDCVCYPVTLADDTTPEAIPYLWTDAVPFFAAYYALLAAQSPARQADAQRMFDRYTEFVNRARRFATPSVLAGLYPQQPDLTIANKLGMTAPARGAGGGG